MTREQVRRRFRSVRDKAMQVGWSELRPAPCAPPRSQVADRVWVRPAPTTFGR
jgi:hypothetical protein